MKSIQVLWLLIQTPLVPSVYYCGYTARCQAGPSIAYKQLFYLHLHFWHLSFDVSCTVPAPVTVMVTPPVSTILPGPSTNLTCTVEISPAVDVPVTVTTVWTGPAGFMTTNTAHPVMGSTTTYSSTIMVSSFGTYISRNYTCTATVKAMSSKFLTAL